MEIDMNSRSDPLSPQPSPGCCGGQAVEAATTPATASPTLPKPAAAPGTAPISVAVPATAPCCGGARSQKADHEQAVVR